MTIDSDQRAEQEVVTADAHRGVMIEHLRGTHQDIAGLLEDADFEDEFPFVFGQPDADNAELAVRSKFALLLLKAQMHMTAVIHANRNENLHSMTVHTRVILECAAWIAMNAHAVHEGTPKALDRILNADEYDHNDAMLRALRGRISRDEAHESVIHARTQMGDHNAAHPRTVTIADRLRYLVGGKEWYDFLSTHFASHETDSLSGPSMLGGVLSAGANADRLAIAVLLDFLAVLCARMLLDFGFVLIAINGDHGPFRSAQTRLASAREDARSFRDFVRVQQESAAAGL